MKHATRDTTGAGHQAPPPASAGDVFWHGAGPVPPLPDDGQPSGPSALEELLPAPFARSEFPFAGFLATVYDHVAERARQLRDRP